MIVKYSITSQFSRVNASLIVDANEETLTKRFKGENPFLLPPKYIRCRKKGANSTGGNIKRDGLYVSFP